RLRHKSVSPYYRHHMNEVRNSADGKELLINTKGWFDTTSSAIIALDKETRRGRLLAEPGTFRGCHDGVVDGDWYVVTESDNNSIARLHIPSGEVERYAI